VTTDAIRCRDKGPTGLRCNRDAVAFVGRSGKLPVHPTCSAHIRGYEGAGWTVKPYQRENRRAVR
jgi:hypothetical protein